MAATSNNLLAPDKVPANFNNNNNNANSNSNLQQQRRKSTLSGNGFFIDYSCTRRRSSAAMQARGQVELRNQALRAHVSPVRWARNQSISGAAGGGCTAAAAAPTMSHPTSPSRGVGGQQSGGATALNRLSRASYSAAYLPRGSFLAPLDNSRKASVFMTDPTSTSPVQQTISPHLLVAQRRKSTMVTGGAVLLPPPPRVVEHMTSALSAAARGSSAGASRFKRELAQQVPVIGCSPTSIRASLAALDETRRCEKMLRQLRRRQHRKEKRQRKREKRIAKGLAPEPMSDEEEDDNDDEKKVRQQQRWQNDNNDPNDDNFGVTNLRRASSLRRKSVRAIRGAADLLRRPGKRRYTRNDLMSVSSIDLASSRSSLSSSFEQQFQWQRSRDRLDVDELYVDDNTLVNFDEPLTGNGSAAAAAATLTTNIGAEHSAQSRTKSSLMRSALKKLTTTISGKPSNVTKQRLQQQRLSRASRALSFNAGASGPSLSYLYYYYYLCEDSLDEIDDLPLGATSLVLSQAERRAQLHMNYSLARIRILNSSAKIPLDRIGSLETQSGGEEPICGETPYDFSQSSDVSLALSSSSSLESDSSSGSSAPANGGGGGGNNAKVAVVATAAGVGSSSSNGSYCALSKLANSNSVSNSTGSSSGSPSRLSSNCSASQRQLQQCQQEPKGCTAATNGHPAVGPSGATCPSTSLASSSIEEDYASVEHSQDVAAGNRHSRLAPVQTRSHSPVQSNQQQQQQQQHYSQQQQQRDATQFSGHSLSNSPSWQTPLQSHSRASSHRHLSPSSQVQVEEARVSSKRSASFADSVEGGSCCGAQSCNGEEDDEQELDDFERFNRYYKPAPQPTRPAAQSTHFDRRFSKLRLSLKAPRSSNQPAQVERTLRSAHSRNTSMSWDTLSGNLGIDTADKLQQQQQQVELQSSRNKFTYGRQLRGLQSGSSRRESSGRSTRTSSAASASQVLSSGGSNCCTFDSNNQGRAAVVDDYCGQCRTSSTRRARATGAVRDEDLLTAFEKTTRNESLSERERAHSHSSILHLTSLDQRPLSAAVNLQQSFAQQQQQHQPTTTIRLEPLGNWPQRSSSSRDRSSGQQQQRRCTSASLRVPRRSRRQTTESGCGANERSYQSGAEAVDAISSVVPVGCSSPLSQQAPSAMPLPVQQQQQQMRTMRSEAVLSTSTTMLHDSSTTLLDASSTSAVDSLQLRARALSTGTGSGLRGTGRHLREGDKLATVYNSRASQQLQSVEVLKCADQISLNQQSTAAPLTETEQPSSDDRSEQLDILALLRKNSFTCTLLGAHQVGKRTIVKCFVKLLNEFKQAVDEYRKERMLSKLMDCSEQLQNLAAATQPNDQQQTTPPERPRLNSMWLTGSGAMNQLLHLPSSALANGKRRLNSMVVPSSSSAAATAAGTQGTPGEQRRHTTLLEPVCLGPFNQSAQVKAGEGNSGSSNIALNSSGPLLSPNNNSHSNNNNQQQYNSSSNYLSVAGSSGQQHSSPGALLSSPCNKSDHDISYSCYTSDAFETAKNSPATDLLLGTTSDFQLQVPSSPFDGASCDARYGSSRHSSQLLSPSSAHNIRFNYNSTEELNGATSAARQSRLLSIQPANVVANAKPPLISLKKLNKRRIKVRFKTRRQLNERYLSHLSNSIVSEDNNLQPYESANPQRQQQQQDKSKQPAQMPDSFMIIYSINDRESFDYAKTLIGQLRSIKLEVPLPIVIVANKIDLERAKVVKSEEGRALAKKNSCKYIEISCTIGHNLDNLLVGLRTQFILKHHTILNSVLRHGKTIRALNEAKSIKNTQREQQQPIHRPNALVRFYKRYVVDNGEQNYDCDNFSKL